MTTALPPVQDTSAQAIMDLEREYLLQNYARYPLVLARGKGCYLYDLAGKRYLDLITGIGVNALGHAHPRITKIIRAQAGLWPTSKVKLRALFHNTRQVENTGTSTGGSLANEVSFICEWYPRENLWFNLSLGHSRPGPALAASGLGNPFALLNTGAAPLGTRNSLDMVLATSWRF